MKVKILVDSSVLINTLIRLNHCVALLIQTTGCMLPFGVPTSYVSCMAGICDLLEIITDDFYNEVRACVIAEVKATEMGR